MPVASTRWHCSAYCGLKSGVVPSSPRSPRRMSCHPGRRIHLPAAPQEELRPSSHPVAALGAHATCPCSAASARRVDPPHDHRPIPAGAGTAEPWAGRARRGSCWRSDGDNHRASVDGGRHQDAACRYGIGSTACSMASSPSIAPQSRVGMGSGEKCIILLRMPATSLICWTNWWWSSGQPSRSKCFCSSSR